MSQFLTFGSSFDSKTHFLNKEMSSSAHLWSQKNLLSSSAPEISWSYPSNNGYCGHFLAKISAKFMNFNSNFTSNSFKNSLKTTRIEELLSSRVLTRIPTEMSCDLSDSDVSSSSAAVERTAFPSDVCVQTSDETLEYSSDSSTEKTNKMQINDSKVLDSMQNDRQKKKRRKRRRRKKKTAKDCSPKKCFLNNDFISVLFCDQNSDYSESSDDLEIGSNEEISLCFEAIGSDLELMCESLFVDYLFHTQRGNDETDCPHIVDEMTAIDESVRKANEKWNESYSQSSDKRSEIKVRFCDQKPKTRVLCVWDFASRRARCGQWEELARDRQRFAEKCRRIETQIGYVLSAEHRKKVWNSRLFNNN